MIFSHSKVNLTKKILVLYPVDQQVLPFAENTCSKYVHNRYFDNFIGSYMFVSLTVYWVKGLFNSIKNYWGVRLSSDKDW